MDPRTQRIRALNDQLRQNLATGVAVMTPGVAALGEEATARIIKRSPASGHEREPPPSVVGPLRGLADCPLPRQFSGSLVTIVFNSIQTRVNREVTTRGQCKLGAPAS